jgi:ATP-binding cassette subfamily B protein
VRIEADIRRDLFGHMQELSFSFYDRNRTGHLMSRVTGDLFEITDWPTTGRGPVHLGGHPRGIVHYPVYHPLGTGAGPVRRGAFFHRVYGAAAQKLMSASGEVKARLAGINGEIESSLSGMRTAKAFANESVEIEKFARSNDRFKTSKAQYYRAMAAYFFRLELL